MKEFPNIDLLVQIFSEGAPVAVTEKGDLRAATEYGNPNSVRRFSPEILAKNEKKSGGRVDGTGVGVSTGRSH